MKSTVCDIRVTLFGSRVTLSASPVTVRVTLRLYA
jgi:hypothetical protein